MTNKPLHCLLVLIFLSAWSVFSFASFSDAASCYTYDNVNHLKTVTQNGNRESVTYPNGVKTTYVYDKRNKLVKATTPNDTVTYQYASNGLRTQQVVGGATTNYLVDSPNQATAM